MMWQAVAQYPLVTASHCQLTTPWGCSGVYTRCGTLAVFKSTLSAAVCVPTVPHRLLWLLQVGCQVEDDQAAAVAAELAAQEEMVASAGGASVRTAAGQVNVWSFLSATDSLAA